MPELYFQLFTIISNVLLFSFVVYYFFKLNNKEKQLEKKEGKVDADYHHVVNDALAKERQILDDATHEADQIITGANYIKKGSQDAVNHAIELIIADIQKESLATAQQFMQSYTTSLAGLSTQSVHDFQQIVKSLEVDLHKEVKQFHETLLPKLEKELDEYKQVRIAQTDQLVTRIVQKTSQEVLNKVIPLDDHHTLMVQALEKAKKEGLFS